MRRLGLIVASGLVVAAGGCVSHTRPENAALPQPWPQPPNLADYQKGEPDDPSVGGDILKGYTPAELAAARAAATQTPPKPDKP
jgi:hypothetical protein